MQKSREFHNHPLNKAKRSKIFKGEVLFTYLLIAPGVLVLLCLILGPMIYACVLSTLNVHMLKPNRPVSFVGLDNFLALSHDPSFINSVRVTLLFNMITTALALTVALAMALALDRPFRGRGLVRSLALIPWIIPPVVSGLMWRWLYMDQGGLINGILLDLGIINTPILWLGQPTIAFWAIVIQHVWSVVPFLTFILLAGLQNIPRELYECGYIDGANSWQVLWNITLPLLRHVILVALILKTLFGFLIFDVVYTLTRGGPLESTMVLSLLAYKQAFENFTFSYSAATSLVTLFIILVLTVLYFKILGGEQN